MNSCNLRGFMIASSSKVCFSKNFNSVLTRGDGGFLYFFNDTFDTFQNGWFDVGNGKEYEVYLKNDRKNISVYLGTTSYEIFPNTSLPVSFPFLSFMMKESYLFVKTGDDYPVINITFDGGMVHKDTQNEFAFTSYPYVSVYHVRASELYQYNKDKMHSPIITSITYSE